MKGLSWSTATNTTLDNWLSSQGSAARSSYNTNQAIAPTVAAPVITGGPANLGSAVIDGLLIQHMKFTTTGL